MLLRNDLKVTIANPKVFELAKDKYPVTINTAEVECRFDKETETDCVGISRPASSVLVPGGWEDVAQGAFTCQKVLSMYAKVKA